MESYFNEVSLHNANSNHQEHVRDIIDTYNVLKKYSFSRCRVDSSSCNTLRKMFSTYGRNGISLFYSMFCQPFDNGNDKVDNEYLMHTWQVNEEICQGLAYAYLNNSISISLSKNPWNKHLISVKMDEDEIFVNNAFLPDISYHREWLESFLPVNLITTATKPSDKQINLRDDHGKDILLKFSKQICNSPYVIKVINSMPFNNKLDRFIRRTYSDGKIELVLNWTDLGYGIIIQTTGRNKRETDEIGEILKAAYSK